MTTYVFPGQGSQSVGMGKELFAQFPEYIQKAQTVLGYDIEELCLHDPNQQLNKTNYTQPALFTVNALYYLQKIKQETEKPRYLAGHSLGEYNALFAAGVFDFETGLKLVQKRGELMSKAQGGAMAAVIDLSADQVQTVIEQSQLKNISIANYNSYKQIVISGLQEEIELAQPYFEQAGASLYIPLKVSGAFHSPIMQEAQAQFETFLQTFTFAAPSITVIANITAKPYEEQNVVSHLANQITHPVLWAQTIEYIKAKEETQYEELGPGKVLSGLIRRILQGK